MDSIQRHLPACFRGIIMTMNNAVNTCYYCCSGASSLPLVGDSAPSEPASSAATQVPRVILSFQNAFNNKNNDKVLPMVVKVVKKLRYC